MKVHALLVTAALAGGLALTTTTSTAQDRTPDRCHASRAPVLCTTTRLRTEVWRLQRLMGEPLTMSSFSDRRSPSRAYRVWVRDLWQSRLTAARREYREWKRTRAAIPHRAQWLAIAKCETRSDWQWDSGTYQGGLGMYWGTWDQFNTFGFPSEAYLATPDEQMVVAEAVYRRFGFEAWGCHVVL